MQEHIPLNNTTRPALMTPETNAPATACAVAVESDAASTSTGSKPANEWALPPDEAAAYAVVHRRMSWVAVTLHAAVTLALAWRVVAQLRAHASVASILATVGALALGFVAADFVSGFVHWMADHYGTTETPVFGPHIIRSFREHHVNPLLITEGDFITTNGDTSRVTVPLLLIVFFLVPASWVATTAFIVTLCGFTLFTAQAHKWAHEKNPPAVARWLHRHRILLSPEAHAKHHTAPYNAYYCITAGWFNPLLERTRFFRRLEKVIERTTGLKAL